MKYPRLPETLDRRKRLLEKDKEDIRLAYQQALPFPTLKELAHARKFGLELQSRKGWFLEVAEIYSVHYNTIYCVTEPDYYERLIEYNVKITGEKYRNLDESEKQAFRNDCKNRARDRRNRFPVQREYQKIRQRLNKNKEKQINLFDEFKEMFTKSIRIEDFEKRPENIGVYFTKIKENK